MTSLVVKVVETNLRNFATLVNQKYQVQVPDDLWRNIQSNTCPVLLKSGARVGQPCGGKVAAGKTTCSRHPGEKKESKTPKTPGSNPQWRVKQNTHGLFVNTMAPYYVVDRNTSVFYGKLSEFESGKVLPLSDVDKELLRARGRKFADAESAEDAEEATEEVEPEDTEEVTL